MTGSHGLALGVGLALVAPTRSEAAPSARAVDLEWSAAPGCPARDEVLAEIRAYVGDALDRPHDDPIEAHARVQEWGTRWSLELALTNSGGRATTHTTADGCRVLAQVTALKIAVALDPILVLERLQAAEPPDTAPTPPPSPEAAARLPRPAPLLPREPPRRSSGPRTRSATFGLGGALRAGGGAGLGTVPKVGFPVTLGAALLLPRLRLDVGAWYWTPRKVRYDELPEVGGTIALAAVSVDVCPVLRAAQVEFPLCAGLEAGAMLGAGFGVRDPARDARAWVAARLAPTVLFPVHPRLSLFLQILGLFPIVRPGFAIDQLPELHRARHAAVAGIAGLEVRFGPLPAQIR